MDKQHNLRSLATSGLIWSALERFGNQGFQFIVQVVLARLLLPEQFGLIAMVSVFIAISTSIMDAGFTSSLIQKEEIKDKDLSTVFYCNLLLGVVLTALLWLLAPWIAAFYKEPEIVTILQLLSLSLLIRSFAIVQHALLRRKMQFRQIFKSTLPATLLGGLVGIVMALQGYGVWSLIAQTLTVTLGNTIILWMMSSWRPQWTFSKQSLYRLLPFGSRMAAAAIINQVFENLYVLIIGRIMSPIEVAFYIRAKGFQQLPINNLTSILSSITFPLFSMIQRDLGKLRQGLRKALLLGSFVSFTCMAVLASVATPLILVLIGEKWLPSAPMLEWICVLGALYPVHSINLSLLSSTGKSNLFLRVEIFKKLLVVTNIVITYRFGIMVMIYGMVVTSFISLMLNTYYSNKIIRYGLFKQLKDLLPLAAISLLILIVVHAGRWLLALPASMDLLLSLILATITLLVTARFLPQDIKREVYAISTRLPFLHRPIRFFFR